jgi:hypothetical protein
MLDIVVAMPDVVVAIVIAKKLTEKGLPRRLLVKARFENRVDQEKKYRIL